MNRPATLAEVARRVKAGEQRFDYALSEFIDLFYSTPSSQAQMIAERPDRLSDSVLDAMLGAVGEHLALRWKLPVPRWTGEPERFLRRPHFTSPLEGLKALLLAESPVAFRRRLIFTEAEPLRRARMPVGE